MSMYVIVTLKNYFEIYCLFRSRNYSILKSSSNPNYYKKLF